METKIQTWKEYLAEECSKEYFLKLKSFIAEERKTKLIHPTPDKLFACFKQTELSNTRVVIMGAEPYPSANYNDGLAWSTTNYNRPASLNNIFNEVISDWAPNFVNAFNLAFKTNGLSSWAKQGVLLMNGLLTVEDLKPGSHQNKGWETFTSNTLSMLSKEKEHLVFIFWGNKAQQYKSSVDGKKHLILEAGHPDPKSKNAFRDCKHFTKCNNYLNKHFLNIKPGINWFTFNN